MRGGSCREIGVLPLAEERKRERERNLFVEGRNPIRKTNRRGRIEDKGSPGEGKGEGEGRGVWAGRKRWG